MTIPLRVLIVEDNPDDAELMILHLVDAGFQPDWQRVETEADFLSALEPLPDLILSDWSLPHFSGLRALKLHNERGLNIPFVIVSGSIGEEIAIDALHNGADDYVLKDRPARLGESVRRALADKKLSEERKHADAVRRESEARHRAVVQSANDAMISADSAGNIVDWNPGAERTFGYTESEIRGQSLIRLMPAHYADSHLAGMARLQSGGKPHVIGSTVELEGLHKDGSEFPIELSLSQWQVADETFYAATIRNISDRKKAQAKQEWLLQQVQFQFRQMTQIVESVPQGMLLLDVDGRVLLANPTASRYLDILTEVGAGDILTHLGDQPLADLLIPPSKGSWHEMQVGPRIFEIMARLVAHDSGPEQWVLLINEVTQARQMQTQVQQQERLATVGQMAAGMAHDFNNIMGVIVLYAQMLEQSPRLLERDRQRLTTINEQAQYASALIRQILDFSRRSMLKRQPLDLLSLVKEQIQLLKRTLPESIVVQLNYSHGEYTVHADPTRMQQMVMNLAINAGHAMPDGGSLHIGMDRITIAQEGATPLPLMEAGEWVQMTVADTGTGISPKVLSHIFDPFYTTKSPGEGTGLGLAQVHGIVGQHEGHIDVQSQVDVGTTFTIYLPGLAMRTPVISAQKSVNPQGNGEVLLVVEDNPELRSALVETLAAQNYRMLEAANGVEALAVLNTQGNEVALVLSDVVMPEMGGIALFHALKEQGWTLPMILLTGHSMKEEMKPLREQGLRAWLLKPPDLKQLTQAIASALKASPPVVGNKRAI
jgi:two-component system, cell cycle sensor histidine kinase and response regulator CckA